MIPEEARGEPAPATEPIPASPKTATLRQVMSAVFWSFFGIRKGKSMAKDSVSIKPAQAIIVGIVFAAMFVATLLVVVRLILRNA